jgi:LacI family transcriptional regulator
MADMEEDKGADARQSTMVDVARLAGVSLKTVSRVLNDEVYVRDETRTTVRRAARALNYTLNQAARTLRGGGAQIVLLLVNNPSRSYLESVHLGALQKCHALGMQLALDECADGIAGLERLLDTVSPTGLIITPPLCDDLALLNFLDMRKVRYALIAPNDPTKVPLSVNIDDAAAAQEMTEHLLSLGHKRVGFILGHPEHGATERRHRGYVTALTNAGIAVDQALIRQGQFDWASGLECAESLLDMEHPPSAIFASNDDMAAAVISAAYRRHIRIPNDLSVVGFDDTHIAAIISPQLTTVAQPIAELASEAANLLVENAALGARGQRVVNLNHRLVFRESAAAAPQ